MAENFKPGPGVLDDETRARLYFYNQLASHYPGTQRVRRARPGPGVLKVPKDAVDLFLKRLPFTHPKRDGGSSDGATHIPVKMVDDDDALSIPSVNTRSSQSSLDNFTKKMQVVISICALPFTAIKRARSDRYKYVANDATHTSARRLFKAPSYRGAIITVVVVSLIIASIGSIYIRQQTINRREAASQAQFEKQRQVWLCALDTFQHTQAKQISQEASCSK